MIESLAGINPAGPRLERGGQFPISQYSFDSASEAQAACKKLQAYVDERITKIKLSAREEKAQKLRDRIEAMRG